MRLDTLEAEYVGSTGDTVTFSFKCSARLEEPDEASALWGLEVMWNSFGMKRIKVVDRYLKVPDVRNGTEVVTPYQQPQGVGPGDVWKPGFEHTFPKTIIVVQWNDQYLFNARLVPVVSVDPSNYRNDMVAEDIK